MDDLVKLAVEGPRRTAPVGPHLAVPRRAVHQRDDLQTCYLDQAGLLRRLDHAVDILGGGPAVQYPSRYREFDGIMVPTSRRVHVHNPDGTPVPVSVAVHVIDVSFR